MTKIGLATLFTATLTLLSVPMVSAVSSMVTVVDTLEATVLPGGADIELYSPDGDLIVKPEHVLKLAFNGVKDIKLKVTNRDSGGNVIFEEEFWTFDGDYSPGAKEFVLNLDSFGGYGNFTFEVKAVDRNGVPVEKIHFVVYKKPEPAMIDGGYIEADSETGDAEVDVDVEEGVSVIRTEVYDKDGKLVRVIIADTKTHDVDVYDGEGSLIFKIPDGFDGGNGRLIIPLAGVQYGEYTAKVNCLDENGGIVGNIYMYTVGYISGPFVPVPDTGSFFGSLDVSREDYLITGALLFAVIGVVAFAVVKKNKR